MTVPTLLFLHHQIIKNGKPANTYNGRKKTERKAGGETA